MHEDTRVRMAEAELEDAVVGDRERAHEGQTSGPPVRRIDPSRLAPRQPSEDPCRGEELEACERCRRARERGLEMERILEEQAEVALGARIVRGEQSRGQREQREHQQRQRNPAIRATLDRWGRSGGDGRLGHRLIQPQRLWSSN
jgi:hypothetical protein